MHRLQIKLHPFHHLQVQINHHQALKYNNNSNHKPYIHPQMISTAISASSSSDQLYPPPQRPRKDSMTMKLLRGEEVQEISNLSAKT